MCKDGSMLVSDIESGMNGIFSRLPISSLLFVLFSVIVVLWISNRMI